MTTIFKPGDTVYAGNTLATIVKADERKAIIRVGADTRVVDPVSLRMAE